jgi:hypothetical protein
MEERVHRQTQRRDTNLYAFRRLKWGNPAKRFAMGKASGDEGSKTAHDIPTQVELAPRRLRELYIDAALWIAAIASTLALGWTILTTTHLF